MNYMYDESGLCREKSTGQEDVFSRCFGGPPAAPLYTWSGSDELNLLGKLASKVRAHDFNAGIFLGTGHQTVALIGDAVQKTRHGLLALHAGMGVETIVNALNGARGRTTGRGKPLPHLSEHRDVELSRRWLEASYGWMPLFSDVYAAGEALAAHVSEVYQKQFRVRSRRITTGVNDTVNTLGSAKRVYRQQLIYRFKSETDFPSEFVRLGLTDPFSVAWELVPWSFAIDWFIPFGQMLECAAIIPKLSGTFVRTITDDYEGKITLKPASKFMSVLDPYERLISVQRSVGTALQVPRPSFKSPLSPSWKRTANQIALLVGFRGRTSFNVNSLE